MICPVCEKETVVSSVTTTRKIPVMDEILEIPIQLYKCSSCGYDQIEDHNNPQDEIDTAFRMFRAKHNMLQPETIKKLIKKFGLQYVSQEAGINQHTLEKYAEGALQSAEHDAALQKILFA